MADPQNIVEVGLARLVQPGQTESGDLEIVQTIPRGVLLGVVDGLGHGLEAAMAAKEAVKTMKLVPDTSVIPLVRSCHEALKSTRGATMSLAVLDACENTVAWLGVGDIEGILLRADPRSPQGYERLLLRPGVVGYILPPIHSSVLSLMKGDLLVFATDGVRNDFAGSLPPISGSPAQEIADHLCSRHAKGTDDALVLVARYMGNGS